MSRVYNFSAGPATLPLEVLEEAQKELVDYKGSGMSLMESSHRGKEYNEVHTEAVENVKKLLGLSDDYAVLFLQGGASGQFAMIPMNLIGRTGKADYFRTGSWSKKAIAEAKRFGSIEVSVDREIDGKFTSVPSADGFSVSGDAAYVHYTPNETIEGVEFPYVPDTGEVPLVADMSSTILSRPIDVSRFGLIYAGAQKNIGPAGLTIVIVDEDLIGRPIEGTPVMFDYATHADNGSMYNTPPTYGWYLAGLVFKWLKDKGGLAAMAEINERKAKTLYDEAVGWAVFDNAKVAFGISGGGGHGVAVSKASEKHVYMKMGTAGIGLGLGVNKFQVVFLFQDEMTLKNFIENGWQADAGATASAGKNAAEAKTAFVNGLAIYQLTEKGLMLNADIAGTKYWLYDKLNE